MSGDITWRVSKKLSHLRKNLVITTLSIIWAVFVHSPCDYLLNLHTPILLEFSQILHLNKASIRNLICCGDKTDRKTTKTVIEKTASNILILPFYFITKNLRIIVHHLHLSLIQSCGICSQMNDG